jgi:serine/threonine protein kinase
MASVYLARDPNFRRNVAIKLISVNFQENPLFRERFEREAHLIAQIEHPAIVPVYDYGEQDDQLYLVMRYMAGGTLADKIKEGQFTLQDAVKIMAQIAPALDAVHAQGVVHRDLKPGNILLDGFGNAALSDFGIAHLTAGTNDLTGSAVIGTPSYMSPEQVRGDKTLDGRSDIYALGVILFEMLTGHGPFHDATPMSVALKHLTEPIPSICSLRPDLPQEVEDVLSKALAKERELRFATATELVFELQAILEKYPGSATSLSKADQPSHREEAATELESESIADSNVSSTPSINTSQSVSNFSSSRSTSTPKRSFLRTLYVLLAAGVGVILFFICGSLGLFSTWLGINGSSLFAKPETTITPSPIPTPPAETVLFADDFSDPTTGWPTIRNAQGLYAYQSDGYHIAVNGGNAVLWAKTNRDDSDVSIYTDARPIINGTNGYYGLLCRIQDDRNFYYFVVQSNGSYTIGKYKDGGFQSFFPEGWRTSSDIKHGDQANRVKADCYGSVLRLYANGILLGEAADQEFNAGFSGLIAAALDSPQFEVVFNNFLITTSAQ